MTLVISFTVSVHAASISQAAADRPYDNLPTKEARKIILDNGLTVLFKSAPATRLVSIDARVAAGSAQEGAYAGSGISHFIEHMIFKGTRKRGVGEIEKKIRSLGGTINGATSYDYTVFTITIPSDHFTSALDILSDSLFNANMNRRELDKERGVILKEMKLNKDDPMRQISRLMWSLAFRSHPYRYPIIGHESLFIKLTREDLLKHHKRLYLPNNMILTAVGDIEEDIALSEIKRHFGSIDRGILEDRAFPQEKPQISKRSLSVVKDISMAYFALGYRSTSLHHPDMPALDILSNILGQGGNSRLNDILYRKKELVYSIGCWNYTPRDPGIFIISGVAEPEKLDAALGVISEELSHIISDGVDESEIERAKKMISTQYIFSLESLPDQADSLAVNEMLTGNFNYAERYLEALDSITREDVSDVAKKYLNSDSLSVVTLSPEIEPVSVEAEKMAKGNIQKYTLPNGLKVLVMEDHSLPTISLLAACTAGLRAETEKTAGISNLTGQTMIRATRSRSEAELASALEEMGAGLGYFSGHNSLGMKMDILSKDMDKGLELFMDIVREPSFNEAIVAREKGAVLASIDSIKDNIFKDGMKAFKENLFRVHPYRFQTIGINGSVSSLTAKDLEEFHSKYFIPNNMVLAAFGDLDAQDIKKKIESHFSGMKAGSEPEFTKAVEPSQGISRNKKKKADKEQSLLLMGFKGATMEGRDRHVLHIISTALSGITGRLSARLRQDLGVAYSVGSFSVPALDPGYFVLYVATTAENIERSKEEFINQVRQLNKKGLSSEELESAKGELIGNQSIALQTKSALAYQAALDELYGLGHNRYKEFARTISLLTNDDIIRVSRKYLDPGAFTLIVIEGKPEGK